MPLIDYQFSMDGFLFGENTAYHVENVAGLGLGSKRARVYETAGGDGVEWGREYRNGKTLRIEGTIHGGDPATTLAAVLAFEAAWDGDGGTSGRRKPRTTLELRMKLPGQPERVILGRPDRFDYDIVNLSVGHIIWQATFDAAAH